MLYKGRFKARARVSCAGAMSHKHVHECIIIVITYDCMQYNDEDFEGLMDAIACAKIR